MTVFLEIVKIALPALIVAFISYYLIREMLSKQVLMQEQKIRQERQDAVTPLRMQAYERLSILVERLSLSGLLMRNRNDEMKAITFKIALLMAIQQEFEHNISQQIYVSDKLWQILEATRDDLVQFIELVSNKLPKDASSLELAEALMAYQAQRESNPIATAQMAIRKEATSLF
ncbi:MAG: hypothetical protein AAGJ93_02815 [Bacteroidota bacterium]